MDTVDRRIVNALQGAFPSANVLTKMPRGIWG